MERLQNIEAIASIRAHTAKARKNAMPQEPVTEAERERSQSEGLQSIV